MNGLWHMYITIFPPTEKEFMSEMQIHTFSCHCALGWLAYEASEIFWYFLLVTCLELLWLLPALHTQHKCMNDWNVHFEWSSVVHAAIVWFLTSTTSVYNPLDTRTTWVSRVMLFTSLWKTSITIIKFPYRSTVRSISLPPVQIYCHIMTMCWVLYLCCHIPF